MARRGHKQSAATRRLISLKLKGRHRGGGSKATKKSNRRDRKGLKKQAFDKRTADFQDKGVIAGDKVGVKKQAKAGKKAHKAKRRETKSLIREDKFVAKKRKKRNKKARRSDRRTTRRGR